MLFGYLNMETYLHRHIHDLLLKADHPVFIADERIDGDTLGSALAVADYLASLGKKVPVFVSAPVPVQYQRLPRVSQCTTDIQVFADPSIDLVVSFDCSDGKFIHSFVEQIPARPTLVNIDHHTTNDRYGDVNQVIDGAPATAYVIYRFFEVNRILPSKDAATCLLVGLCFDTMAFTNSATNDGVLEAASQLVLLGARVQDVIRSLYQNRSIAALRVWGLALERLQEDSVQGTLSTFLTRNDLDGNQVTDDEIDGISNFLNIVIESKILLVLRETPLGDVKVSMRSLTQDVSVIAKANGGGGHVRAAGYTIPRAVLVCGDNGCWRVEKKQIN
jgi:phosphoesterase RecJ-like protein